MPNLNQEAVIPPPRTSVLMAHFKKSERNCENEKKKKKKTANHGKLGVKEQLFCSGLTVESPVS